MDDGPSDGRRFALIALGALWLMSFIYAFVVFAATPIESTNKSQLAAKSAEFLGWQGIAGIAAVAIFGVGLAWEKDSATRRLSIIPLGLALLQAAAIVGIYLWAQAT